MPETDNKTKLDQFSEFFSVEHDFTINVKVIEHDQLPSFEQFVNQIPMPFKIASDIVTLDQASLRPLQSIAGVAAHLVEFLNHQTQKIDLLLGYMLTQQDNENNRYSGTNFGGGGVIFNASNVFSLNQIIELKVFLVQNNCAIFCLGEIIAIEKIEKIEQSDEIYQYKVIFHHIRDEDREMLVRTSLHEQSKQLQLLAQQRKTRNS
jgi:hypothetical protein